MAKNGPVDPKSKSKPKPKPTRRSARLANSNSRTKNANDDDDNNNNDTNPAAAEPPTGSHRRNSKSPLQVNPVAAESLLQSTTEEQGQEPSNDTCDSGNAKRTQKSCRKRKRNTVLKANQVALSDSDMEMEIDDCDDGHGRAKKKRKTQGTVRSNSAASSLTHGPAWHGWNKQQEIALFNAYLAFKPCTGFWKKIAKMVPGKSSIECFNRFYSAHPTPPCSHPRSRISMEKSGSPIKPFASNISSLFSSAMSKRGNYGMSKRKMLSARKLARQMLRQNRGVDKDYETDLFPIVEDYVPAVTSFAPPISPLTPWFQKQTDQNGVHAQSLSHCPPKTLSRFSKDSTYNFKMQCTSPEILKPIKNQQLHDRYIDILHSREIARKKASAEKYNSNLPEFNSVDAARAAMVAGAEQVLAASQSNLQNDQSDTFTEDSCEDDREDEEF